MTIKAREFHARIGHDGDWEVRDKLGFFISGHDTKAEAQDAADCLNEEANDLAHDRLLSRLLDTVESED